MFRMAAPVFTRLEGRIPISRHDHVAVLYRGRDAAFRLASFLAEGLERGESCHYLAPRAFHAGMIDEVKKHAGNLDRFFAARNLQLHEGPTEVEQLRGWTQGVFEEAERDGASAVRWLEEGTWHAPTGFPTRQFFENHALLNYQVKHYACVALCQYDLERLDPPRLFSAIGVHRHLIINDTLIRDNPFYIPAERFIPLSPEERERDLVNLFREAGFDVNKFLDAIVGFGRLQRSPTAEP